MIQAGMGVNHKGGYVQSQRTVMSYREEEEADNKEEEEKEEEEKEEVEEEEEEKKKEKKKRRGRNPCPGRDERKAYKTFDGKPNQAAKPNDRPKLQLEVNIKMNIRKSRV